MINLLLLRFKQLLRDKKLIIFAILLPLIFCIIVYNAINISDGFRPIPIGIADEDKTDFSSFIIDTLKQNKSVKLEFLDRKALKKQLLLPTLILYYLHSVLCQHHY